MTRRARLIVLALVGVGVVLALALRPGRAPPEEAAPTSAVVRAPRPKLVELGSSRCTSCKAMHEELAALRQECPDGLDIEIIDVFKDEAAAETYGVSLIPTQVFVDASGREFDRHQGFLARADIRQRFARVALACP